MCVSFQVEVEGGGLAPVLNCITGEIEYNPNVSPLPDQKDGLVKIDIPDAFDGVISNEKVRFIFFLFLNQINENPLSARCTRVV